MLIFYLDSLITIYLLEICRIYDILLNKYHRSSINLNAREDFIMNDPSIKIFLAGSTEEVGFELDELFNDLSQLKTNYQKNNINLEIHSCRLGTHEFRSQGQQEEWNAQIKDSDIFVALIFNEVRQFTQNEIELAISSQKATGRPKKILICFLQNAHLGPHVDHESVTQFRNRLYTEYNNYKTDYDTIDTVKNAIRDCIQNCISEINPNDTNAETMRQSSQDQKKSGDLNEDEFSKITGNTASNKHIFTGSFIETLGLLAFIFGCILFGYRMYNYYGYFNTHGHCGTNITWILENDTLTISGVGEPYDYSSLPFAVPWFFQKNAIQEVQIDSNVSEIGSCMFENAYNLKTIHFSDSVISIGSRAFVGCSSLESVDIPANVINIGSGAFSSCISLKGITVDENNINYSSIDGVLYDKNASVLIQYPSGKYDFTYEVPDSVTKIQDYAFYHCSRLVDIKIPETVSSIGSYSFAECENIKNITLPSSITIIKERTFFGCTQLTDITIPASVLSIEIEAFRDCANLDTIYFDGKCPSISSSSFLGVKTVAYYPKNWKEVPEINNSDIIWESYSS